MSNDPVPRYSHIYRNDEIRLICQQTRRGESVGFVGVAGVGKSNLVNYLIEDKTYKAQYFGERADKVHFCLVNGASCEVLPEGLWEKMLSALTQLSRKLTLPEARVIPLDKAERAFSRLQALLQTLCRDLDYQVIFILDDFDKVIEIGPLSMLEQLSELRSDGNREKLSYLVFTKRLPHVLGRQHNLERYSKFYDLIRHNLYALEPYASGDAHQMLEHLNEAAGRPLRHKDLIDVYRLAGGHGQLLKVVFKVLADQAPWSSDAIVRLPSHPDIQQECQRIIIGLHPLEQEVARRSVRGTPAAADWDVIDHLARRGLISVSAGAVSWFSPLMAHFLRTWEFPEV